MANDYFRFKHFTIWQQHCAMKVGTDGVLLGAWADGGKRILDIGTGTGLIALMMAQRFPSAEVTAVEIDRQAALQARENVSASPFANRVNVVHDDILRFSDACGDNHFDAIVCNPPFFINSLKNPDSKRALARHNDNLSFCQLFSVCRKLLIPKGCFSLVAPLEVKQEIDSEAVMAGFFQLQCVLIKTTPNKLPKRCLMKFSKQSLERLSQQEVILQEVSGERSEWYQSLTDDFYLSKGELSGSNGSLS